MIGIYVNYNCLCDRSSSAMVIGWKKKKEEKVESDKKFKCSLCSAIFKEPAEGDKRCPECYAEDTVSEVIE